MTNSTKMEELLKACDEVLRDYYPMEFKDDTNPTMVATALKSLLTEHDGWVWVPKEALHVARYVMEVYSMQTTYMSERIGGVLNGCPRGKTPTPDELSRSMQIALDKFNELLAAAPKQEEPG